MTIVVLLALAVVRSAVGTAAVRAPAAGTVQACSGSVYPRNRDPSNPLDLARKPGADPLRGAHFFVNGPRHGLAAGAMASLLGVDPTSFPEYESWATFIHDVRFGPLSRRWRGHPRLARKLSLLEKIASEPESQRFSIYSNGGGRGAISDAVNHFFCGTATADPGAVPLITTYFLWPLFRAGCPSRGQILAARPTFKRRIDELASATGRHPAVFLAELDAVGSSGCISGAHLAAWEDDLRYEITKLSRLPHTVVYVEGGYSDAVSARRTAAILNAVGVVHIRGFFTNDTHFNWTINEIRWGDQVSRMTHGAHFVVNTADNGRGPKLNPGGVGGIEDLCNPPRRGIGPKPNTNTGFHNADAFEWTGTPGRSAGQCHPGDAPPGLFGLNWALSLAAHANGQLGPGFPSLPY